MNQSNDERNEFSASKPNWALKWLSRLALLALLTLMTYVATRQSYNFSHWIPHHFFRDIGVPYSARLWAEQNADIFLHFFGAMSLTALIYAAKISKILSRPLTSSLCVAVMCVCAEIFQYSIGRGFESSDLLLGFFGIFMAYSAINKKN